MKTYVLGYGSLMNLESASRTLKKKINKKDVITVRLLGYKRNWSLADDVYSEALKKETNAIFLNIEQCESSFLNAVIIPFSKTQLEYLKTREKNYHCVDVTNNTELLQAKKLNSMDRIFTFVGKDENIVKSNKPNCFVFQRYIDIVSEGLKSFDDKFCDEFERTTEKHSFNILSGTYSFINEEQNKAR